MKRILIVEDDSAQAQSLQDLLCTRGFDVGIACDGVMALSVLTEYYPLPCLILMNLNMPNMDGWTLRERLKEDSRYRNIPVVIISGDASCTQVDAEAHFIKPIDLRAMLAYLQ